MGIREDAVISSQGRVTIPKRIRERLAFEEGTTVEFIVEDEETVRVRLKRHPMERIRKLQRELPRELRGLDPDVDTATDRGSASETTQD